MRAPRFWLTLGILLLASPALAQGPVSIQQAPTELRASQICNEQRGTGALTATIPALAGLYFYINSIELNSWAQAAAAATLSTPGSYTAANISGTPTLGVIPATAQAAGTVINNYFYGFAGNGLKSATPGTAVTITAPSIANVGNHIAICGYYAP